MKPVIVIGAGGHAGVLIAALRLRGIEILGIVDADPKLSGMVTHGLKVLGGDEIVLARTPTGLDLINGVGSVSDTTLRLKIFERFKTKGFTFATVLHPSAIIAPGVTLGEGSQVMAGAIIQSGSKVGQNTIINTGAIVDHDGQVGEHVHIAPGVTLSGSVTVGNCTHIGTGTSIIQGVRIGSHVTVGAGSVVLKDLRDRVIAYGVPAKEVKGERAQ